MKSRRFEGKRIWLTGASSGIGRALAGELARQGARLVLSGRNLESLQNVLRESGSVDSLVEPFDVTDCDAHAAAAERIRVAWGGLDIAIFNAGTCEYVDLPAFDADIFRRQMDVNFLSVAYGVEAALPLLRRGEGPTIVGVSSAAAITALPRGEAYGASKAALRYLLTSLRADLRSEGINVIAVLPGFVQTPLTDRNDFPMPFRIHSSLAARRIADGIARGQCEIHFPKRFTLLLKAFSILPLWLQSRLLQQIVRRYA